MEEDVDPNAGPRGDHVGIVPLDGVVLGADHHLSLNALKGVSELVYSIHGCSSWFTYSIHDT